MKKKSKIIISVISALASIAAVTSVSLAVFSDRQVDDTTIQTGDVAISTSLDGGSDDGGISSGKVYALKVSDSKSVNAILYNVSNTGSKRSYIRAQITPVVQNYNGSEWVTATDVNIKDVNVYVAPGNDATAGSWIYSDGYYYFPNVVASGSTIYAYIGSDAITDADTRVIYDVDFQATQATHDAYVVNWGLGHLPAGVEILQSADGYR